jgi:hypothetical protein
LLFADGTVHMTGTFRHTFSWDLLPTDGIPDMTGTVVNPFGANGQVDFATGSAFGKGELTFTVSGKGTFTDGTKFTFHNVGHIVFDATGVEKVLFEKVKVHCG